MKFDSPALQAICALLPALLVLSISLYRHKRLDRSIAGGLFVALTSGFAIPKGLFLCAYLFSPDPPQTSTKLHGYEREIFAAGAIVVFLAIVSIWSLCEDAAKAPEPIPQPTQATVQQPAPNP
jgi:hypothetical protein